jgi:hypothetical protein
VGRKLDSYKFRIAEDEIDFNNLKDYRTFWRKHVTSLNKRDREMRDAINWDSMPPFRHVVGAAGERPYAFGWEAFGSPNYLDLCYWKTRDDIVVISGMCKKIDVGATIFTLPTGYRPINGHVFLCEAAALNVDARVDALSNGQVYYQSGGSPHLRLSLAGISFPAEEL